MATGDLSSEWLFFSGFFVALRIWSSVSYA